VADNVAEKVVVEKKRQARALVFELETLVANSRPLLFDLIKKALAEKDVAIKPFQYTRRCLDLPLKQGIHELIKHIAKGRATEEKILEAVAAEYSTAIASARRKTSPEMEKLLKKASEKGIRLGAATGLASAVALELLKSLGVEDLRVSLYHYNGESKGYPTADTWLKLAKQVGVMPPLCTAVATSMKSMKSALAAGMRAIAVLDEFTNGQDYGGSDLVVDRIDKLSLDRVFELTES
jgi:beta-phosphoglucomutase-like phosphatase (HAD superfamily)